MLIFVAVATMIGGNFAALTQTNVKRLLAYSSIAHVGYMLLGLVASDGRNNSTGIKGILVYLLVYTFMNLGAFAVITSLRRRDIIGDELEDWPVFISRRRARRSCCWSSCCHWLGFRHWRASGASTTSFSASWRPGTTRWLS